MLDSNILHSTLLCQTVQCCGKLYYTTFQKIIEYYKILCWHIIYFIGPFQYIVLHYVIVYYTMLYYVIICYITLCYNILSNACYIILVYIISYYTIRCYPTLYTIQCYQRFYIHIIFYIRPRNIILYNIAWHSILYYIRL